MKHHTVLKLTERTPAKHARRKYNVQSGLSASYNAANTRMQWTSMTTT